MTIDNSKQECIESLSRSLSRAAKWRRELQAKFDDPRNERAAVKLDQMATETANLSDDAWSELKSYYNWASRTWSDAVSQASRCVEFRHVNSFPAFTRTLANILSEQSVA